MDKERYLKKLDDLQQLLNELDTVLPETYREYQKVQTKRSCERIAQLLIEVVIDICSMIVRDNNLGLPGSDEEIFNKLEKERIFPHSLLAKIRGMKKFRNVLVHWCADVDDKLVFNTLRKNHQDFKDVGKAVVKYVGR